MATCSASLFTVLQNVWTILRLPLGACISKKVVVSRYHYLKWLFPIRFSEVSKIGDSIIAWGLRVAKTPWFSSADSIIVFHPPVPGCLPPQVPFKKAKERPRQPGFFGGFRTVSELPGWKNNTLLETSPVQFNRNCNLPIFPMALRVLIQKEMKFHSSIGNASFRICASKGHCTNLI